MTYERLAIFHCDTLIDPGAMDDERVEVAVEFPGERALVIQLAGLLDLSELEVAGLLAEVEARVSSVGEELKLTPGDLVVFTGMSESCKAREYGIPVVGHEVLG